MKLREAASIIWYLAIQNNITMASVSIVFKYSELSFDIFIYLDEKDMERTCTGQ